MVEIQSKPGRSGRPSSTMVFIWTRMDGSCALFSIWPRPDGPEGPECDKMHTRISLSGRMYAFTNVYRLIMSMMIISSLICPTAIQSEIIFTTPQKYFKFFVTSIFEILEILRYFRRKSYFWHRPWMTGPDQMVRIYTMVRDLTWSVVRNFGPILSGPDLVVRDLKTVQS